MSNPQVTQLIEQLSQVLEQNRQKRQQTETYMRGVQAAKDQQVQGASAGGAKLNAASGFSEGLAASQQKKPAEEQPQAQSMTPGGMIPGAESGYGGDGAVSPYSRTGGMPRVSSSALSPSTTREGRLELGGDYARTQQLLSENPYRMEENAPAYRPNTDPALEEQKRRFTQNLMLSRGQSGGPLGGAGQSPPQGDGLDPNVVNAVSRSGGPIRQMGQPNMQAQPMSAQGGPPQGWSPDDYALLESLSQRYPGG